MPILGLITRFVLAAAIGLGGALGLAALTAPPASNLLPSPEAEFELTATSGDEGVAFGLTAIPDEEPVRLQALPDDAVLQLVSFVESEPGAGTGTERPRWLAPAGYPRVPHVTQFDGGPLENYNCTMASGAMLARLGYGLVLTGSQVRALSGKLGAVGTSLVDLAKSFEHWGVTLSRNAITPLQLRALLYAGAGAVIQVTYGVLPVSMRLQADFTGGHAIYLDGFTPSGPDGRPAYWVNDPIGYGPYKGEYLPADTIEAAALDFGGGRIYTAWAFPGGTPPANPPPLPIIAFPGQDGSAQPSESPSTAPTESVSPAPSSSPTPEPTPPPLPDPDPEAPAAPAGDDPPPVPPDAHLPDWGDLLGGGIHMSPLLTICIDEPKPAWCPGGIIGVWPKEVEALPLPPLHGIDVKLLFAEAISGGQMRVIFQVPEGVQATLQYWDSAAQAGALLRAPSVEAALLDGMKVQVATFPIEAGVNYNFVASARALGLQAISQVGTAGP
jgi:hypothetical protein